MEPFYLVFIVRFVPQILCAVCPSKVATIALPHLK